MAVRLTWSYAPAKPSRSCSDAPGSFGAWPTRSRRRHNFVPAACAAGAANVSWQAFQGALPAAELASLSLLEIKIDYATRRGGSASITSQQKKSLTRAVWKASDVEGQLPSPGAPGLQLPLRAQPFYRALLARHRGLLAEHRASADQSWRGVPAAELLLNLPGVEVAARPWLYLDAKAVEWLRRLPAGLPPPSLALQCLRWQPWPPPMVWRQTKPRVAAK
ncbi:unnamed protein product [Effrenium voratum]|nr:unnamed protein product [Effrenium voratum]